MLVLLRIDCLLCKGRTCWGHLASDDKGLLLYLILFVFFDDYWVIILFGLLVDCLLVHGFEVVRLWLEQRATFNRLLILSVEVVCYRVGFLEWWVRLLGNCDVYPCITPILRYDNVCIAVGLLSCLQSAGATKGLRSPPRHFLTRRAGRWPCYFGAFGVLPTNVLLLHDRDQVCVEAVLLLTSCCVLLLVVMVSNRWAAYVLELKRGLRWRSITLIESHCCFFLLERRILLLCL